MSSREERVKVFEDTMKWCQDDDYLSASIEAAKKATKVYYEDDYPPLPIKQTVKTEITVSKDRSYQAAIRLIRENPDCRIAVLNFANAFHAGGGVTKGSSAQEESL